MLEVELKARLTESQALQLPELARQLGFVPHRWVREVDSYLNGLPQRDFRKSDEALRLRTVTDLPDGPTQAFVTYKGPKVDSRSSARTEFETTVGDSAVMAQILAALGYVPAAVVDKTRRTFRRDSVTLCLDRLAIGPFLELEILLEQGSREQAVDQLLSILDQLGVSREALTRESYLELLMASATV